jgi:hypothetical protein
VSDSWPPGDKTSKPPSTPPQAETANGAATPQEIETADTIETAVLTEATPTRPLPVLPVGAPAIPPVIPAVGPAPLAPFEPAPSSRNRAPGTRPRGFADLPTLAVRLLATLSVAAFVTTYVATEVDLVRRHFPGIEPAKYWLPQFRQITLPGLGATLLCAVLAYTLHRLRRRS